MNVRNRKKAPRGFTLIELVIVIAVIAILAALLVPTILGQAERARISRARADVAEIAKAFARMRNDTGFISTNGNRTQAQLDGCYSLDNLRSATAPASDACGAALVACSAAQPGQLCWGGPYLSAQPLDPFNTNGTAAYGLVVNPTTNAITVRSVGPDTTDNNCAAGNDDICVTQ